MAFTTTTKGDSETVKKAKGTVFIEHIKAHLKRGDEGTHDTDVVVCKICDKTVDEIYEEYKETPKK